MRLRGSRISTSVAGMKSAGPWIIHRSPGERWTPPSSNSSVARSSRASPSARTWTLCTPPASRSPGWRKNEHSPLRTSRRPNACLPSPPTGSVTKQYCRELRTVMGTFFTTSSYTSGMWLSDISWVTSHSSPALRRVPYTSSKVRVARRCTATRRVTGSARTVRTKASSTSRMYEPTARTSHCSPVFRAFPWLSVVCFTARSRSASLGRMIVAGTTSTTCSSTRGRYVQGPRQRYSSPASRICPASVRCDRSTRRCSAWSAVRTVCAVGCCSRRSPGYNGNGSPPLCSEKRISSSPCASFTLPCSSKSGALSSPRSTGFRMMQ
mmetsp:Transcript_22062/g.62031  ORF Transcript_22062/g.62031 Transcript_22062/m.62031 type:complete len:323 (+) Transcript_22062:1388-2356(+)